MTNPLSSPIQASVLNLGACQDEQFASDGVSYGAFTGALLQIWDNGRFIGDYRAFRSAINMQIGDPKQTPALFEPLLRDPEFVTDRPFTLSPAAHPAFASATPAQPPHASAAGALDEPESEAEERDQLPDVEVETLFGAKARGLRMRSSDIAQSWPDYAAFDAFIGSLGLKNFATDEFLVLGGSHNTPGGPCAGKNAYPPRNLWVNMAKTARVLDRFRDRIGKPIVITNAYRAPAYNSCIGGATRSQHVEFRALDFRVQGMAAFDVAQALRRLRDEEKYFVGGIGRYNSFTHIDTRNANATWPPEFRAAPLPAASAMLAAGPRDMAERIATLGSIELAQPRSKRSRGMKPSVFADSVNRTREVFDPGSAIAAGQQGLNAAVSASSVISFVDNLSPDQKEDVLLSTLFAQRAADAKADPVAQRAAWYDTYMEMMSLMGWVREAAPFEATQKMKGSGSFDKVILATLAQIATGNQFKIVESAIKALSGLAQDDGKIELFDFETSRTTGGNFQIGSAEASGAVVSMALGAFNFTFKDKKQNILFVSWGKNELDYWLSAQKLSLSPSIYAAVRDTVRSKLAVTRKALIVDIDIV